VSLKHVECVEYDCDGHCGAKQQVTSQRINASLYQSEMPAGWVTLTLSEQAAKEIGKRWDNATLHFCPACFAIMTLPMWNSERLVALLSVVGEDELDDYGLTERFAKARVQERQRLEALKKQAVDDIRTGKL